MSVCERPMSATYRASRISPVRTTALCASEPLDGSFSRRVQHKSSPDGDMPLKGALRGGIWAMAEKVYMVAMIKYFLRGELDIRYNTTLRGYLAKQLHCDPMRISKMLIPGKELLGFHVGHQLGRQAFIPIPETDKDVHIRRERASIHLARLRAAFIRSVERHRTWSNQRVQDLVGSHPQPLSFNIQPDYLDQIEPIQVHQAGSVWTGSSGASPRLPSIRDMLRRTTS